MRRRAAEWSATNQSSTVETVRYVVAVLALVTYPAGIAFWMAIHPFVRIWRRAGLAATYSLSLGLLGLVGRTFYVWRDSLLGSDLGTRWPLLVVSTVLMAAALAVEWRCRRHLSIRTLVGVPELSAEVDGVMLDAGMYGRVRHPRYLGGTLGMLAIALWTNYVGTYVLAVAFVPAIYLVTVFEERELVERFGETYREYQERVPRLVPWPRSPW